MEAHRSHLYPVMTPVDAYAMMAAGEAPYEHWYGQGFGQDQWLKDSDFGWQPQFSAVEAYRRARVAGGATLRTVREHAPPHPVMRWADVAQELVDQADWGLPGFESGRRPVARLVPYPGGLPFDSLPAQATSAPYPMADSAAIRSANRERAMAEIRAAEAEWDWATWER